jgi:hypothetical protein
VKTFLAELYLSRSAQDELGRRSEIVRQAAEQLTAEGKQISYERTLFVPEDESCFYVFTGQQTDDVAEVCRRAGIPYERITEAVGPEAATESRSDNARQRDCRL